MSEAIDRRNASRMPVTQISIGRFHHFHLARQLEKRDRLEAIWTGYPRFRLRDEEGIAPEKIRSFPWLQTPYMGLSLVPGIGRSRHVRREVAWWAHETLDLRVAASLRAPTVLVALSGSGLHAGRRAKSIGGRHVCDRGSTHIGFQDETLREEYARWALPYWPTDPRSVAKEEAEYEQADLITVPSRFCLETFLARGVPASKMRVIPYGARLERFFPTGAPDPESFTVLFVGHASVRKGFFYLLEAFERLDHPRKRLRVIGAVEDAVREGLARYDLSHVEFLGTVPNASLPDYYSRADVMILPSVEEGLALVMAEALACGCPVIATPNTGAGDLFTDGCEGFIVPVRSAVAISEALEKLAEDRTGASEMRSRARGRVVGVGGWDRYGQHWEDALDGLAV